MPEIRRENNMRTLFVYRLDTETRARELGREFERFGPLVRCDIPLPRFHTQSLYAFVEFENADDARAAFDSLNGRRWRGQQLSIEWAKREEERKSRFKNDRSRNRSSQRDRSRDRSLSPKRKSGSPSRSIPRERSRSPLQQKPMSPSQHPAAKDAVSPKWTPNSTAAQCASSVPLTKDTQDSASHPVFPSPTQAQPVSLSMPASASPLTDTSSHVDTMSSVQDSLQQAV